MAITLTQLCRNAEQAYNMKLIAGSGGMENTVRWVHMVEDSEVPGFLHGNELVFTTGIGHFGSDWLSNFVKSLKEHNAAGVVLNLGPYITTVPPYVIVYCEENNFPLFTIPWQVHIIDITYSFCRRIIENEEQETSLAESFRNLIFAPENRMGYAETLERLGFHENSVYTILAVNIGGSKSAAEQLRKNDNSLWRLLKHSRSAAAMFYQDGNLIAVRQQVSNDEMRRLLSELSKPQYDTDFNIGISESGSGYSMVAKCYNQAVSALSVAKVRNERLVHYKDIGVYKLLFGVENREIINSYVDGILGDIIRYDNMNGTDYENTLRIYLKCSGSVQQTSAILNVHRNTINYKIKVIREITGMKLNDEDKMNLLLAFRAKDIFM